MKKWRGGGPYLRTAASRGRGRRSSRGCGRRVGAADGESGTRTARARAASSGKEDNGAGRGTARGLYPREIFSPGS